MRNMWRYIDKTDRQDRKFSLYSRHELSNIDSVFIWEKFVLICSSVTVIFEGRGLSFCCLPLYFRIPLLKTNSEPVADLAYILLVSKLDYALPKVI